MSEDPTDTQPMLAPGADPPRGDFGIDARTIRARDGRARRTVPWQGCPLIPADALDVVPESANLAIRILVRLAGEEVPFERRPFPLSTTPDDLLNRYGPAEFVAQLIDWVPGPVGSISKPLAKVYHELRPRSHEDVGQEAWPIRITPEVPRAMLAEMDRRRAIRGEYVAPAYGGAPAAGGGNAGGGEMFLSPSASAMPQQSPQTVPGTPPPGYSWVMSPDGQWQCVPETVAARMFAPRGFEEPQRPAMGLGALVSGKSPEELLALAAGALKLFRDMSGSGERAANADVERERIRQEYELRKQEMQQQHMMFLEQMKFQMQQMVPQQHVDANAIRAQALAEARMESMAREQERLRDELRATRINAAQQRAPDLITQIQHIKQQADVLGLGKKTAPEEKPGALEQIADLLDTEGGKVLVDRLATKFLSGDDAPHPHPPPPPPSPPQQRELPEGYEYQQLEDGG